MTIPAEAESSVDVLVIGAGPSGLMAAHGLARAGVNVRIVDQRPAKVAAGQADGIQPRTIEVLQSYGLAERLLREGNQMHMAAFYNPSPNGGIVRTGRTADITAPSARYPFEVTLHQGAIEAIFLDSMAAMGVHVERPVVPTSIELSADKAELKDPHSHPVKVVLKCLAPTEGQPETEVVNAKYVIGADGAHSWVRKSFGISMDGEQTNYIWGVVDIVPDSNFPDVRNRCAIHSTNGSCMIIPREGDKIRLYIQLTDTDVLNPETGRVDKNKMGPEKLMEVAKKTFYPYTMHADTFDWWTIYIIGQRVASKFSVNERVFIAGDACHTHSPKAGQGMNASMNDTHNLIWKLSHVLRGWADMSLLKTYEFERRKYAQDLIDFDRKFSALFSGKPRTSAGGDGVSHEEFLQAFQTFGAFTSGIGIHYAPSPVVHTQHQAHARALVVGQRMRPHVFVRAADARPFEVQDLCPADTRFKVLVFAGDTSDAAQRARVQALADAVEQGFYRRFGGAEPGKVFDVLAISSAPKDKVDYTDLPPVFRTHWSKVLLDDTDMFARVGGGGYDAYGIDKTKGAVVVVRPDGYVGIVAPFESIQDVDDYFAGFMKA
ncbi:phenol 2-monooxygenase [Phanerochaete sordida]|uniref:Phenol 2-monooxygenase n=1 Tax=Phanerochaete sordida TaxID=48140 RepID=A0A9P3GFK6_9APHY|nr:phenol 2-monooxygenase [Phanerochaete sordida]